MKLNIFKKKKISEEEKKRRAKIELVIFLAFIAFVFAYSKVLLIRSNSSSISKEQLIYKVDLNSINKYDFNIKVNIDDTLYDYSGNIDNNNGIMGEYKIVNGEYYDSNYNVVNKIFHVINNKYLNLHNISNYIKDENYKNGKYGAYVNDIINNSLVNILVYVDVVYNKDNVIINIDYSNLAHSIDKSINSYKVEYIVSNFK